MHSDAIHEMWAQATNMMGVQENIEWIYLLLYWVKPLVYKVIFQQTTPKEE